MTLPPFLRLLRTLLGDRFSGTLALAAVAGIFQAMVVVIINAATESLAREQTTYFSLFAMFLLSIGGYVWCVRLAATRMIDAVGTWIYAKQHALCQQLVAMRPRAFERLEQTSVYKTLIENTDVMLEASRAVGMASAAIVMVAASLVFIFSLSTKAFVITAALTVGGVSLYMLYERRTAQRLTFAKGKEQRFLELVGHLLAGFKELKMHRARRQALVEDHMASVSRGARHWRLKAEALTLKNYIFADVFFLVLVAAIVFVLPQFEMVTSDVVLVLATVILYALGPLEQVVVALPLMGKANLAVLGMEALEQQLAAEQEPEGRFSTAEPGAASLGFQTIALAGAAFQYERARPVRPGVGAVGREQDFAVGPLDFTLRRGELVFIVGGNGSGKSTLLKMLAGLYTPQRGALLVDGEAVDARELPRYREFFSTIFSDFHLFDRLYGLGAVDDAQVTRLLERMELAQKTTFRRGEFSTLDLSSGQRRRVGLVMALLEEREVCLFDEVAADLDPPFRQYFYETFLPGLKADGRTVVAVSHDEKFFHVADRVLRMEFGRIVDIDDAEGSPA